MRMRMMVHEMALAVRAIEHGRDLLGFTEA